MQKIPCHDLVLRQVTIDDPELARGLPLIAVAQGIAHKIRLPDQAQHFLQMANNFRHALQQGTVEIWRIEKPSLCAGALFLSRLQRHGEQGLHIDGLVVMPEWRRHGLGSALLQFVAAQAIQRGLSFISWECEDHNPAQGMYQRLGAMARSDVMPFRLTREKIIALAAQAKEHARHDVSFGVSSSFSLFRAASFGIAGFDMDPKQNSLGLQIEDLVFETPQDAFNTLAFALKQHYEQRAISFVDLIAPIHSEKHIQLMQMLNAAPNSYSGDSTRLWQLTGNALAQAAHDGDQIHIVLNPVQAKAA